MLTKKNFKFKVHIPKKTLTVEIGKWTTENGMGGGYNWGFIGRDGIVRDDIKFLFKCKEDTVVFSFLSSEDAALFKLRWT
jgi:hypothetical protein